MSTSRRAAKASTQDDAPSGAKGRLGSKHKSPAASSLKEKQNPKVKSVPSSGKILLCLYLC